MTGNGDSVTHKRVRAVEEEVAEIRARQFVGVVEAFRDGNFSMRLPANWTVTDARMADAFNKTIAQKEHDAKESGRQCGEAGTKSLHRFTSFLENL